MSCGLNRHGSHGWRKLGTCGTAKVSLLSFCHRGFPFFWRPMLPTFLIVATASFTQHIHVLEQKEQGKVPPVSQPPLLRWPHWLFLPQKWTAFQSQVLGMGLYFKTMKTNDSRACVGQLRNVGQLSQCCRILKVLPPQLFRVSFAAALPCGPLASLALEANLFNLF